jgi:hypothetical protein
MQGSYAGSRPEQRCSRRLKNDSSAPLSAYLTPRFNNNPQLRGGHGAMTSAKTVKDGEDKQGNTRRLTPLLPKQTLSTQSIWFLA